MYARAVEEVRHEIVVVLRGRGLELGQRGLDGGAVAAGADALHAVDLLALEGEIEILRIDPALERKQIDRVQGVRARRDSAAVEAALAELKEAAADDDHNLMPNLLDCARVHASEGEIVEALQTVFGTYTETPVF